MQKWFTLFILVALWSPSFLFIKVAVHDIPPITLATVRVGIAAIIMYGLMRSKGAPLPRGWNVWKHFLVIGLFANALPFTLLSIGEQSADSGLAAILNSAAPIFTVFIAHFFTEDDQLSGRKLAGIITGFAGVVTIFLPALGFGALNNATLGGLIALVLTPMCYGISFVYTRNHLRGFPRYVAPTAQLIVAVLCLIPTAIILESNAWQVPGTSAIASLSALILFGTVLAMIAYYHLLELANATFISLVTYFLPIMAIILGILFLDERPEWNALLGCGLILLGIVIVNNPLSVLRSARRKPV